MQTVPLRLVRCHFGSRAQTPRHWHPPYNFRLRNHGAVGMQCWALGPTPRPGFMASFGAGGAAVIGADDLPPSTAPRTYRQADTHGGDECGQLQRRQRCRQGRQLHRSRVTDLCGDCSAKVSADRKWQTSAPSLRPTVSPASAQLASPTSAAAAAPTSAPTDRQLYRHQSCRQGRQLQRR